MTENISDKTTIPLSPDQEKSNRKSPSDFIHLFGHGCNLNLSVCIFISLLSATLMILSFPNAGWGFLAFIAMVPIIFIIETQSKWKVIICYFIYLLVFYYYILDWIDRFHTYALPGLVGYVIVIHYIPLFIYKFFRRWNKIGSIYNVFLFSTIMVIFEYTRELGFARFPYGNIAYTQYKFLPFIQIVDITGYLGISYFIYFVNASIAGMLAKFFFSSSPKNITFLKNFYFLVFNRFTLIAIIFTSILIYGNQKLKVAKNNDNKTDSSQIALSSTNIIQSTNQIPAPQKIRASLIQHWYDYNLEWTKENRDLLLEKLFRLTSEAIKEKPDIIIWPESALIDYYEYRILNKKKTPNTQAFYYYDFFKKVTKDYPDTKFLVGSLSLGEVNAETIVEKKSRTAKDIKTGSIVGNVKKYNSALLINNKGEVIDKSAKMLLVPVGEYFPYTEFLKAMPWFANILDEAQASQFTPFERYKVLNYEKGFFSTLICYEDAFESLSRTLTLHGATFLVLITNDAWGYSVKAQEVHFMFSIFRAIENRRHLLRAGNAGVTGLIDPWGRIYKTLPMFEEGYSTIEFTPNHALSLFTRFGSNLFTILVVLVFVLLIHYSLIMKFWHTFLWTKKRATKWFK